MKLFIGPISINTIDAAIKFAEETNTELGFIPSRRQIDYNGGYVENFNTKSFTRYTKQRTSKIKIFRDHGGEGQGKSKIEDTFISFLNDAKYFEFIHLDPFLKYQNIDIAAERTVEYIKFCNYINPNIFYEISTEEAIKSLSLEEIELFIENVKSNLTDEQFHKIKYLVIQCGTKIKNGKNTGEYNKDNLIKMITLTKKYNFLSKEHNGDYQDSSLIKEKFNLGLDGINIAPEFGVIESEVLLKYLSKDKIDTLYNMCFFSNKWRKWVSQDFIPNENKEELIKICCHYIFSTDNFKQFKRHNLPSYIDVEIKSAIINRFSEILM